MASWKGELNVSVMGLEGLSLGSFKLEKLGEREIQTIRTCPECHVPVERVRHDANYQCPECEAQFKSWYQLERSIKAGEGLKALPTRNTVKIEKADLKLLDLTKVRGLVTKAEYAILPEDEKGEENLQKFGNMLREYGKVAVFKICFRKRGKNHVMYLTVADDNMIMVREIVPLNLVEPLPYGVVFCTSEVYHKKVEELMNGMPKADKEDLSAIDNLIKALAEQPETKDLTKALKKVMIKNP